MFFPGSAGFLIWYLLELRSLGRTLLSFSFTHLYPHGGNHPASGHKIKVPPFGHGQRHWDILRDKLRIKVLLFSTICDPRCYNWYHQSYTSEYIKHLSPLRRTTKFECKFVSKMDSYWIDAEGMLSLSRLKSSTCGRKSEQILPCLLTWIQKINKL